MQKEEKARCEEEPKRRTAPSAGDIDDFIFQGDNVKYHSER